MGLEVDQNTAKLSPIGVDRFNDTIEQLLIPYGLKKVYRAAQIDERKESVCEHVGSMLHLARWFIRTYNLDLNLGRVIDMICDHDLPELVHGDTPIIPGIDSSAEKERGEASAALLLAERMSTSDGAHFLDALTEYKEKPLKLNL